MLNECLLDADRVPTIHIKTDPVSPGGGRFIFWMKKNLLFLLVIITACLLTIRLYLGPNKSQKMLESLRIDPTSIYPAHQDKLRAAPSMEYLLADNSLPWDSVTNSSIKVKAAFVVIAREEEVYKLHSTMLDIERHFNHQHGYPWVIIGHKLFSKEFRDWISNTSKSPVLFGLAPSIEWEEPYWINIRVAEQRMKYMANRGLSKGESMHWRRMTRYNAGFIAFHPLLKDLDYYWKVQPGSRYHCDINHDPFQRMKDEKKKLSFALTKTENHEFIQSFELTIKSFIRKYKNLLQPVEKSVFGALLDDQVPDKTSDLGEYDGHYSNCMIYNNFMIVSLEFLRSKEYNLLFDHLDLSGGFFYERWGDSFPQTMAAAFFLTRDEILIDDITGYNYGDGAVCPSDINKYVDLKCTCSPYSEEVSYMDYCTPKFLNLIQG